MFVYQPTLDTSELKKDTDYILSWKSKGAYNSKLRPLYRAFLFSIKLPGYRMGIKFDKDPLAVEQNNYASKMDNLLMFKNLQSQLIQSIHIAILTKLPKTCVIH